MSTVYQWFQDQVVLNQSNAVRAESQKSAEAFMTLAAKWEARSGMLTVEEAQSDVTEVILWRQIEDCDGRLKEREKHRSYAEPNFVKLVGPILGYGKGGSA